MMGFEINSEKTKNVGKFNQIVPKTKKFLDKFHILKFFKEETYIIRGEKWKTSLLILIFSLLMVSVMSLFLVTFMWFTNGFTNLIYSQITIREDTAAFQMWKNPTPKPLFKMYLFNYTNVENYENQVDKKLKVEEKGPYVYEETNERVNVTFEGDTVSYRLKKTYKFIPELSKGRQNDIVVVPNVLMLAIAALHRESNFFTRLTISGALDNFGAKPFITLPADHFITGYEDNLYTISKSLMTLQDKNLADKAGLLNKNIGVNPDVYTMKTGMSNINDLGRLVAINHKENMDYWSTEECDKISGTDGTLFSPLTVAKKEPISVFLKDMARNFNLNFEKEVKLFDGEVSAYRYKLPENIFDEPEFYANNQCYCEMNGGTCPPRGIFNLTLSMMGAPTFVSHPHFYRGDPKLFEHLEGLTPNNTQHGAYLDLHPLLGFPMQIMGRVQGNVQISKSFGISQLDNYEDGMILPISWTELFMEDKTLPQDVQDLIKTITNAVGPLKFSLKYGSLLIFLVTLIPLIANLRHKMALRKKNLTAEEKNIQI